MHSSREALNAKLLPQLPSRRTMACCKTGVSVVIVTLMLYRADLKQRLLEAESQHPHSGQHKEPAMSSAVAMLESKPTCIT